MTQRPCTCDTFKGESVPWGKQFGNCRLCWLFHTNPSYHAQWGGTEAQLLTALPTKSGASLPCVYLGKEIEKRKCGICGVKDPVAVHECVPYGRCTEKLRVKGDDGNHLACCLHGFCKSYTPPTQEWTWVVVPPPERIQLYPVSKRAIVTVVTGSHYEELFSLTEASMKAYAYRVGADFIVLRKPGHYKWPISAKFQIASALDWYDQCLFVDCDVLFQEDSVNVFDQDLEANTFCFVDTLPNDQDPKYLIDYYYLRQALKFENRKVPWVMNTGVMLVPKSYKDLLLPPAEALPVGHCMEQNYFNAKLLDSGRPYKLLDKKHNWSPMLDGPPPKDAVLHFYGYNPRVKIEQIRKFIASSPEPLEQAAPPSDWCIDRRHREWIGKLLSTGNFDKYLEVGCYTGYSLEVALRALREGKLKEVHACDVQVLAQLNNFIQRQKLPGFSFHHCKSLDLLSRDPYYDLVFLDGDHSEETVIEEVRRLIEVETPIIILHDTNCYWICGECSGPVYAKRLLQSRGYLCIEDNIPGDALQGEGKGCKRPGERTQRGMLVACRSLELYEMVRQAYVETCS